MSFASLPNELRPFFAQFLATSKFLHATTISEAICDMVRDTLHEGIVVYDAFLGKEIMVFGSIIAIKADNPMHTALCGGLLGGGRVHLCRGCEASYLVADKVMRYRTREELSTIDQTSNIHGITRLAARFLTRTKTH